MQNDSINEEFELGLFLFRATISHPKNTGRPAFREYDYIPHTKEN